MHIVASIQARLGSTRLPGKVLLHLGDRRILQWVLDRTAAAECVDQTVAAIGDRPENVAITEYCNRENVQTVVGPEENLLARHIAVAEQTDCDLLVRITADCPFVPAEEIDRVVAEHLSNDARYTTNNTDRMPIGTAVDALDPDLLSELDARGETHPVERLHAEPDEWQTVWTDDPGWHEIGDVHIAVDTPENYWALFDAVEATDGTPRAVAEWLVQ